jgi:hypothetical protein
MKTIKKFYKNSNTGELIKSQEFTETLIKFPVNFYDAEGNKVGENLTLEGFVEIKEKKFKK